MAPVHGITHANRDDSAGHDRANRAADLERSPTGPATRQRNSYLTKARPAERSVSRVLCTVTIPLGPSLPAGSSDQPGVIARATRPLSGLASGGVYRARSVTGAAVRSYRTISPLPTLRLSLIHISEPTRLLSIS